MGRHRRRGYSRRAPEAPPANQEGLSGTCAPGPASVSRETPPRTVPYGRLDLVLAALWLLLSIALSLIIVMIVMEKPRS